MIHTDLKEKSLYRFERNRGIVGRVECIMKITRLMSASIIGEIVDCDVNTLHWAMKDLYLEPEDFMEELTKETHPELFL